MFRLLAVLLLIPLLDAMLLVVVAGYIGAVPTVLLVVLTALVGMLLVRAEGRHTLQRIQQKARSGEVPTDELLDGGLLIAAGAFALTPGLVTDFLALVLVVPFTRYPIRLLVKRYVVTPYVDAKTGGFASGNVYVGGFPGDDPDGQGGVGPGGFGRPGPGPGNGHDSDATNPDSNDVYDVDEDAYDIDFDDDT